MIPGGKATFARFEAGQAGLEDILKNQFAIFFRQTPAAWAALLAPSMLN